MQQIDAQPSAVSDRLAAALASETLPKRLRPQAQRALDVLSTPRKVTLIAAPGSDTEKTQVLNLLAGAKVVPVGTNFGTVQLRYGAAARTHLTLADGSKLSHDGLPDAGKIPGASGAAIPALTEVEAPLPALRRICVTDLAPAADAAALQKALRWAEARTEIAIWCSQVFDRSELALWQTVPDILKDHALLLGTEYGALSQDRDRATALLKESAGDEFASVMAISAAAAWQARSGDAVDTAAMQLSGGSQLVSVLLRQIASIEQHAMDRAEMCFATAGIDLAPAPRLRAAQPAPAEQDAQTAAAATAARPTLNAAVARLKGLGARFVKTESLDQTAMLEACAEALDWMDAEFAGLQAATPEMRRLSRLVQDGSDILQLLRMEADRGAGAGAEAISIMVQLKRSLQSAMAA